MFCWCCSLNTVILCATDAWFILCTNKIYTYVLKKSYFIFPITKGSVIALMKHAGFSTSNKVKNHCTRYTKTHILNKIINTRKFSVDVFILNDHTYISHL